MAEISLPPIDDLKARGKKIADSSTLNWIYRGGMIVACGMIVYFSKGTYETVQSDHTTLTSHTGDIANVQKTVNEVKAQDGQDHDWIITLRSEIEGPNGVIEQIGLLWHRPAKAGDKPPP